MSADGRKTESGFGLAAICGLLALTGIAAAADDTVPDLEFLEYLGSWEGSDEDWLLFSEDTEKTQAQQGTQPEEGEPENGPAAEGSTELENES